MPRRTRDAFVALRRRGNGGASPDAEHSCARSPGMTLAVLAFRAALAQEVDNARFAFARVARGALRSAARRGGRSPAAARDGLPRGRRGGHGEAVSMRPGTVAR